MTQHQTTADAATALVQDAQVAETVERAIRPALWKGWRCRCPRCGEGHALHSYLKVNDRCGQCDLDLSRARADDGPAYLTILIVGHLMAPLLHVVYFTWQPAPLVTFSIFGIGCLASSLYLLPRMKGIVIAYQWARGMNGFDSPTCDPQETTPA